MRGQRSAHSFLCKRQPGVRRQSEVSREEGLLCIGKLLVAAVVAAIIDELLSSGVIDLMRLPWVLHIINPQSKEPCSVEVDVGHVAFHGIAIGGFQNITLCWSLVDAIMC